MLIGHQCDSKEQRVVSIDEGIAFSKTNNWLFAEISDPQTANDALKTLITKIVLRLHKNINSQFNQANFETLLQSPEIEKKKLAFFFPIFEKENRNVTNRSSK